LFTAFNTLDVFNLLEICLINTDMAQNKPQRKETPPGPSPNSPSLLFEYQCRSGEFIRLANRIESKLFCPNWNALVSRLSWASELLRARLCVCHSAKLRNRIWAVSRQVEQLIGDCCGRRRPGSPAVTREKHRRIMLLPCCYRSRSVGVPVSHELPRQAVFLPFDRHPNRRP